MKKTNEHIPQSINRKMHTLVERRSWGTGHSILCLRQHSEMRSNSLTKIRDINFAVTCGNTHLKGYSAKIETRWECVCRDFFRRKFQPKTWCSLHAAVRRHDDVETDIFTSAFTRSWQSRINHTYLQMCSNPATFSDGSAFFFVAWLLDLQTNLSSAINVWSPYRISWPAWRIFTA